MLKEFKKFALKGNMIDLAVGIIIGGAFNSIVRSLVDDLVMPLLSLLTGRIDFSNLFIPLDGGNYATLQEAKDVGAATFNYGQFISNVLNFILMAFVVFLLVRWLNKLNKPQEATTKKCPLCKSDINKQASKCPQCTGDIEEQDKKN